jgi:hypothetical protein
MSLNLRRVMAGSVAGLVATFPMTALMIAWQRRMPWRSQQPLPPAQITGQVLRMIRLHDDLESESQQAATIVNHFAYGAAMGGVYGALPMPRSAAAAAASGVAFGLAVWSGSYLGWLPAAGLHDGAAEESRERNAMMIAAHVVWGGTLGLASRWLMQPHEPENDFRRESSIRKRSGGAETEFSFTSDGQSSSDTPWREMQS